MGIGLLQVSLDLARQLAQPKLVLRPLNNLSCFLAARDLAGARVYAEEALAVTRRFADREMGVTVGCSLAHVMWTAGQWDEALSVIDEMAPDGGTESPQAVLISVYGATIAAARGTDLRLAEWIAADDPDGDQQLKAMLLLLQAARARADGDAAGASRYSAEAVRRFADATGIDDDFPIFWITAVDDALAAADVAEATQLIDIVGGAPLGHVSTYLRALLLRYRAMLAAAAGRDDEVESDFVAAMDRLRDFGAPFYLARTQLDYGRWLIGQGRSDEATALLDASNQTFEELRAEPWLATVRELETVTTH
jgi:thioredoxin-like negative regulator of GroEL